MPLLPFQSFSTRLTETLSLSSRNASALSPRLVSVSRHHPHFSSQTKTSATQPHLITPPLRPALTLCVRGAQCFPLACLSRVTVLLCCRALCGKPSALSLSHAPHGSSYSTFPPAAGLPSRSHMAFLFFLFCWFCSVFFFFICPSLLLSPLGSAEE